MLDRILNSPFVPFAMLAGIIATTAFIYPSADRAIEEFLSAGSAPQPHSLSAVKAGTVAEIPAAVPVGR